MKNRVRVVWQYLFVVVGMFLAASTAQPQANVVAVTIIRRAVEPGCTMGELRVGDRHVAYTLERPPVANINYISSIPTGIYPAFFRTDGSRGWRVELRGVPDRTNVQIHVGNWVSQTEGCILIGTRADVSECSVGDSGPAMTQLRTILESELGWRGPDSEVRVEIRCEGPGCG